MVRTVSIVQIGEAPYLTVDKENISIGRESSEGEIVISTNCEWEITMPNECDWFTIPTQYGKPGEHSIIYSVVENTRYEERTTSFTIKAADIEKVVTVTQALIAVTMNSTVHGGPVIWSVPSMVARWPMEHQ